MYDELSGQNIASPWDWHADEVEIVWDDAGDDTDTDGPDEESDDDSSTEQSRLLLPVLPLRGTVVFPGVAAPIAAGRSKTLQAIDTAVEGNKLIFAVAQRDSEIEEPTPDGLYRIGTICRIAQLQRMPGGVQLVVQGEDRGVALEYTERDGRIESVVRRMVELSPLDPEESAFRALYREVRERAHEVSRLRGVPKEIVDHLLGGISSGGELADLVTFYTEMEVPDKQELLETVAVEDRLRRLLLHLQRQIGVLEAQVLIRTKVQEELGERQREVFLREQIKAIQEELGDDVDSDAVAELRERLEALDLTEEARKEVDRELSRLERVPRESAESQVIRTYLETIAELPWNERSDDDIDLKLAEEVLDRDHFGLQDVKDRVLDYLAVRSLQSQRRAEESDLETPEAADGDAEAAEGDAEAAVDDSEAVDEGAAPDAAKTEDAAPDAVADEEAADEIKKIRGQGDDRRGSTLLFIGPPGVGKTSIAQSIAEAMGRQYVRVSLGGARDEADIRGHRRTYVGALPGRIIEGLKRAKTRNPVFLLDEVDKLGVSFQGDPSSALMEVLDPAQNDAFVDHYLGLPFDLSDVMFIATANFAHQIPGPLRDRMEAIEFRGYTANEKMEIAKRYLLPRQIEQNALKPDQLEVEDEAIAEIVASYTREAGVRNLERELGSIARKSARRIASGDAETVHVAQSDIREFLGQPKVHPEKKLEGDTVGVSTGLYYTPAGGDIMLVECSVTRGAKEDLVLTGQLGDVMKESARAALTYARTQAERLGIPESRFNGNGIHIHVPAGAVPKEGPSAGIAMAMALISALSRRAVRHDVAMTGEITLTGRVLPIGGVKEKVLGAQRAGIKRIILPADNAGDLEDLPEEVQAASEFILVETLEEVMKMALAGMPDPEPAAA